MGTRWRPACLLALLTGVSMVSAEVGAPPPPAGMALVTLASAQPGCIVGSVNALARSQDGALFVGSNLLAVFDGLTWQRIDLPDGGRVLGLAGARNAPSASGDRMWIAAEHAFGYARKDSGDWHFHSLARALAETIPIVPSAAAIRDVQDSANGAFFVGRSDVLSWDGRHFRRWHLPAPERLRLLADERDPMVYQGGTGLVRFAPTPVVAWPTPALPEPSPVVGRQGLEGSDLLIFHQNAYARRGKSWARLPELSAELARRRAVCCTSLGAGHFAIGTLHGGIVLASSDGTVCRIVDTRSGLPDDNVHALLSDGADELIVGSGSGLCRITGILSESLFDHRTGLGSGRIERIVSDGGAVLLETDIGTYRLTPGAARQPAHFAKVAGPTERPRSSEESSPLAARSPLDLHRRYLAVRAPSTKLYGVYREDGSGAEPVPLDVPGLDSIGEITALGISRESGQEVLWIGGTVALLKCQGDFLRPAAMPGQPRLVEAPSSSPESAGMIRIHSGGRATFAYAEGPAFSAEASERFETFLFPADETWSPPLAVNRREVANPASGDHILHVRATDRFGRVGASLDVAFLVEPPWYLTANAFSIFAVAVLALAYGAFRWRLSVLERRNRLLDRIVAERTRELSLSNTAKSEFLENFSHEIRDPLNGIVNLCRLIGGTTNLPSEARRHAGSLQDCVEQFTRQIDQVLNSSKLEYGQTELIEESFAPAELLARLAKSHDCDALRAGCKVTVSVAASARNLFRGDVAKLQLILGNYLGNAFKYARGSEVQLRASAEHVTDGLSDVLFEVADRGPGVPADEQELIFKRFVRGSNAKRLGVPGTGIGLAACRAAAAVMRGSIGLESEPGKGACFFLHVPLRHAAAPPAVAGVADPGRRSQRDRLEPASGAGPLPLALVVEDQEYNRIVLADMLAQIGYAVTCAGTRAEALGSLDERPFGVILIDLQLAGDSGTELARELRARPNGGSAVLIGVTAGEADESQARCRSAGMDGFLSKPVTPEAIRSAVEGGIECYAARTSPVVDFDCLRRFARARNCTESAAVATFWRELRIELRTMGAAARHRRADEAAGCSHRVRSLAMLVGATDLAAVAGKMELSARQGIPPATLRPLVAAAVNLRSALQDGPPQHPARG
jgi:signal transduction histidine kinase/DNA-binding response OmpR family regulator